jgi:hypothetical protein
MDLKIIEDPFAAYEPRLESASTMLLYKRTSLEFEVLWKSDHQA